MERVGRGVRWLRTVARGQLTLARSDARSTQAPYLTIKRVEAQAMKAHWNGVVLAESDRGEVVEGNYYFPPDAVNREYLRESPSHTTCFWKGRASYHNVVVDGHVNADAAWYYPDPSDAAQAIRGYVAFWKGVRVEP